MIYQIKEVYDSFVVMYNNLNGSGNALLVILGRIWCELIKVTRSELHLSASVFNGILTYHIDTMHKIHKYFKEYEGIMCWRDYITLFSWFVFEVFGDDTILNENSKITKSHTIML